MTDQVRTSRLRYIDADDLGTESIDFSDLDVRNGRGDKLGEVDGFIVDATSERPYYVVVESGGWFSGGRYLVPINHASLVQPEGDEAVLRVNLEKETIRQYPRFDRDEFAQLSESDLRELETRIGQACCPGEAAPGSGWTYESWQHYRQPAWWETTRRPVGTARAASRVPTAPRVSEPGGAGPSRERIVAREGEHVGDRAEPGDVLGIESGGEETHLGDTPSDERRRVEISDREARQAEKNNRG